MSHDTDTKPVEGTAPSTPASTSKPIGVYIGAAVVVAIAIALIVGGRVMRINAANDVINSANNPQPTATASAPVASAPSTPAPATSQPVTPASQPATTGDLSLPPRPDTSNYKAYAQWFEDVIMKGMNAQDTRYFDAAFYSPSAVGYADTVTSMKQNAAQKLTVDKAVITNFKLVSFSPDANFVATYDVAYTISGDVTKPQHESISAIWSHDYAGFVLHSSTFTG